MHNKITALPPSSPWPSCLTVSVKNCACQIHLLIKSLIAYMQSQVHARVPPRQQLSRRIQCTETGLDHRLHPRSKGKVRRPFGEEVDERHSSAEEGAVRPLTPHPPRWTPLPSRSWTSRREMRLSRKNSPSRPRSVPQCRPIGCPARQLRTF